MGAWRGWHCGPVVVFRTNAVACLAFGYSGSRRLADSDLFGGLRLFLFLVSVASPTWLYRRPATWPAPTDYSPIKFNDGYGWLFRPCASGAPGEPTAAWRGAPDGIESCLNVCLMTSFLMRRR